MNIIQNIREQIAEYRKDRIEPKFLVISKTDYAKMRQEFNELPGMNPKLKMPIKLMCLDVVILDIGKPTVVADVEIEMNERWIINPLNLVIK